MKDFPADPVGAAWLAIACQVESMARLPVLSQIGGRRATRGDAGYRSMCGAP
ncbi:hypothetical protein [Verminephrobacter aporrectodeae]|uniref:hypothetical protein n=1 Tax=Verminephrobacter aporrectodeae TaxID=1110389 RepID=UPI00145ECCED|nr:hypothetical protein [Verminephrobacter aporrectodeae]